MKRIISVLLIILLLSSCSKKPDEAGELKPDRTGETPPEPWEVTVTDSAGREVTTSADNGDIVSTSFESTQLIILLGGEKRLTGVEHTAADTKLFKLAFEGIGDVKKVTSESGVDVNAIIEQKPGLVVLGAHQSDVIPKLEEAGIVCAVAALDTIDNIKESITLVGKLINAEEIAAEIKNYYTAALERIYVMSMTASQIQSVSIYNNDEFLTSVIKNIKCDITDNADIVIAPYGEGGENAVTVPDAIERWDVPSVSLVLGLYWYCHNIYPDMISYEEVSKQAFNFYTDFYGLETTPEEVGLPRQDDTL